MPSSGLLFLVLYLVALAFSLYIHISMLATHSMPSPLPALRKSPTVAGGNAMP